MNPRGLLTAALAAKPAATVIKRGSERQWMSESLGSLPDGEYSLYLQPDRKPMAIDEIFDNDGIMTVNADAQLTMPVLQRIVRAVEEFHNIKDTP